MFKVRMQQLFLTIVFIFIIASNLHGQWEVMNEGIQGSVNSVDFIDVDTGWIAGGILLKTEDGGLTWNVISQNIELSIEIIDFIDELNGWAYGWASDIERNVILKTEDGGYHWIVKHQQNEVWYNEIQALNDSVVFLTSDVKIIKTINGGSDWIDISPQISNGYFRSARFQDQDKGIVSGTVDDSGQSHGFISRTYNGGSAWETEVLTEFSEIYDLQFNSDAVGYFLATKWEEVLESFFCRTVNMGQTWEVIYRNNFRIDSYFFSGQQNLYLSMFDTLNNNNLLSSSDGGKNWEMIISLVNWQIPYVILNSENKGLIICNLSGWMREGSNFLILTNRLNDEKWLTRRFSYPLNDVFFFDQDRGFMVGGYQIFHGPTGGDIFSTNDGGVTWAPDTNIPGWIGSCEFANESVGYLMTRDWPWLISKSTDSGLNWNVVYENNYDSSGFDFYGTDMFLSSEQSVWIAGSFWAQDSGGAGIFNSTDGGLTWDLYWTYLNTELSAYNLTSLHIIDKVIWSVGNAGLIAKLIDKNSFQIINYPTDLPLNEIFFSDLKHGWIAGGYGYWEDFQPLLLKSNDGGKNWIEQEDFPYLINEIFFRDTLKGWAVGVDRNQEGIILATNNGGISWFLQADQLPAPLNAIHFVGDYGWAVGELGQVLKTENGGASWIDDKNQSVYASTYLLGQNYPNPFNPKTIINFELPIANYVELTIYNMLGEKVATLISGKQPAGNHQVEWDASGFASGVYFYRLSAEGKGQSFVQTRKLVLLK
jgi:photosystem II stability/assembly factor-like uncharacterized protein